MKPTHETTVEWERVPSRDPWPGCKAYVSHPDGKLRALVSRDGPERVWHVSVTHADRLPSWDEMASARDKFTPDRVTMAFILPPRAEYVNLHERCLHLFQIPPDEPQGAR